MNYDSYFGNLLIGLWTNKDDDNDDDNDNYHDDSYIDGDAAMPAMLTMRFIDSELTIWVRWRSICASNDLMANDSQL